MKTTEGQIKKAFEVLGIDEDLFKAEGSKGGKVIGHTKSGKPIYENAKHPSHSKFTREDNTCAIKIHHKLSEAAYDENNEDLGGKHLNDKHHFMNLNDILKKKY